MPIFAVTTARGPRWDPSRDIRAQAGWDSHAAYMDRLVEQGMIILGGPIDGKPDEVAMLAMQADTGGHVQVIFDADPWIISGVIRLASIRPWTLWLDSRPPSGTRAASPQPGRR
ncbi:MAG: hypothetical protein JOY82_18875 [Streptosporangiaceae bacterium]|nr:hypothetical protein [Streptosporangiaceae bacterium]MBV9856548.1 hypothetical protein [Streptosporangiaceae bacterium]